MRLWCITTLIHDRGLTGLLCNSPVVLYSLFSASLSPIVSTLRPSLAVMKPKELKTEISHAHSLIVSFVLQFICDHVYKGLPWKPAPLADQQDHRRKYRAAVSWTDFNVGRLLATLDQLGLADTTAVIFHGDHG